MTSTNKLKIRLEYGVRTSPALLFNYISSPSGLSNWFCNDVDVYNNQFKFKWDSEENIAELIKKVNNKMIRFRWLDSKPDEYFEFEIIVDELTDDVALVITDFVIPEDEKNISSLWDSQVHDLKASLGA
ncbi:MAG: SRPBCC domain-containing protein [Bacteroidetes bacterium]|jgi:uncharacterized protein YndB with AHSA1/START domain|nr:SRPBCC domain-containing protein [Bacteroidota bacterium]